MNPMNTLVVGTVTLLLISCPAFAAPPATAEKKPAAAATTQPQEFPLLLKNKEIVIRRTADLTSIESGLTAILGNKTDIDDKNTLQYDVQFDPGQAPYTVVFSWDKKGSLAHISLDAFDEKQNPPARELKRWLTRNAGPGKTTKNKKAETTSTTWTHRSWRFVLTEGGDGEDSTYSFEITPLKTK
jgi:hypothetical protein